MKENNYKQQLLDLIEGINNLRHFNPSLKTKGGFNITEGNFTDDKSNIQLDTIISFDDKDTLPFIRVSSRLEGICSMPPHIFEKNHWEQVYYNFLNYMLFAKDSRNIVVTDLPEGCTVTVIPVATLLMEGYERTR